MNQNQQVIVIFLVFILIAAIDVELLMLCCTLAFQVVLLNQIVVDWRTFKKSRLDILDNSDQYRGDWVIKAMFFFLVAAGLFVLDYIMIKQLFISGVPARIR